MEKRKGRKSTKVASIVLLASLLLGGCGGKGTEQTSAAAAASKEHVYKVQELQHDGVDGDNIHELFYFEDKLIAWGSRWEERQVEAGDSPEEITEQETTPIEPRDVETIETQEVQETQAETAEEAVVAEEAAVDVISEAIAVDEAIWEEGVPDEGFVSEQIQFLAVYDYEGKQLSYTEWAVEGDEWYGQCVAGVGEEAIYCVKESYFEDNSDPENYIWEEHRELIKLKFDGTEEWKISVDEISGEEGSYVAELAANKDGQIIMLLGNGKIFVIEKDSNVAKQFDIGGENVGELLVSDTGKVLLNTWGEQGPVMKEVNMETGQLSEEIKIPGNSFMYSFYAGYGYDLFLTDSLALYGYNLGDEALTELMNFVDSDLDSNGLYGVHGKDDTQFYANYYSYSSDKNCYGLFTKVPPEEVKDKKVLTLACCYLDYDVRTQVVKFNKSNEEYRIRIEDYSTYNTEEDYSQSYTKLNTDIVSGKIPDILLLNGSLPVDSYIAKGLFEDLYPYIDKDGEMERSDFVTNVLDAFSTDGKLYQLVPAYTVTSVAAKTSDVGTEQGWTLEELNALMATKPEGTNSFFDVIRETVLYYSIQLASEQFINWETGECSFDSEGFVQLLEFIKQFPAEYDQSVYEDESFWESYDSIWREGKALLSVAYMSNFSDYNRIEKGTFGEEITMIGFPAANRKGSVLDYNLNLAMSSKSPNKEGAWQFLRTFLTYDYQMDIYGFPTNMQCYEEMKQKAMERPYYLEEDGTKVEYDDTYYVNGVEIVIPPMTAEEVQKVEDFIFSIDQTVVYDEDLLNIIREETEAFFEGQKSAKEVAGIIQSRASIYVNENR